MNNNSYERIFIDWNKESRNNKMNVYIGVGGYGCQCIKEMTIGKSDIRILIDTDELLLDSTHVTIRSDATYRALAVNSETDVGHWNKYVIKFSPSREEISGKIMDIICNAARDNEMEINIIIFSTMCGNFGSHNAIEIGKKLENAISARQYDCEVIYAFLPIVNVGGVYALLNDNLCSFIEKCNTNQELRRFLFEKDNVKAFVIYPDAAPEREFVQQNDGFISDIKNILRHIHEKEYIGEKEYREAVIWEFVSCFAQKLEHWLVNASKRYLLSSSVQPEKEVIHDSESGYAFISYSSRNQSSADAIRDLLKKNNIKTWMAPGDIPAGSTYLKEINRALKNCSCFVLLLSEAAQDSQWVPKELERAVNYRKPIFPVQIENVLLNDEFEFAISSYQVVAVQRINSESEIIKNFLSRVDACVNQGSI